MNFFKKSKKGKIFLSLFLAVVMLVSAVVPAAALANNTKYKFTTSWLTSFGSYSVGTRWGQIRKIVLKSTNEPVYCIEMTKSLTTDSSGGGTAKTVDVENTSAYKSLSANAKEGIRLATIYGCHNTTNDAAYAATQIVIWEYQLGLRNSVASNLNTACTSEFATYVNRNSKVKTYYTQIMNNIKGYKAVLPSLNGKTYTIKGTGKANGISITDSNKVLQYYALSNSSGLAATRSNNDNTILLYMSKNTSYMLILESLLITQPFMITMEISNLCLF